MYSFVLLGIVISRLRQLETVWRVRNCVSSIIDPFFLFFDRHSHGYSIRMSGNEKKIQRFASSRSSQGIYEKNFIFMKLGLFCWGRAWMPTRFCSPSPCCSRASTAYVCPRFLSPPPTFLLFFSHPFLLPITAHLLNTLDILPLSHHFFSPISTDPIHPWRSVNYPALISHISHFYPLHDLPALVDLLRNRIWSVWKRKSDSKSFCPNPWLKIRSRKIFEKWFRRIFINAPSYQRRTASFDFYSCLVRW